MPPVLNSSFIYAELVKSYSEKNAWEFAIFTNFPISYIPYCYTAIGQGATKRAMYSAGQQVKIRCPPELAIRVYK